MRALITGADGFVGQWLVRALLDANDEVSGAIRGPAPLLTTLDAEHAEQVRWLQADLRDAATLASAVTQAAPDVVFHLAAQSLVPAALADPLGTMEVNVMGTQHLLEAVRVQAPDARVIVVGSADAYGAVDPAALPVRENVPLRPTNPYAASKAAAEKIALNFVQRFSLRVVVTRSFNHTGPGQSIDFAAPAFAKQIVDIKRNRRPPQIAVGNLSTKRDFCDVRDIVQAYRLLAERGQSGAVYNVCSGKAVSLREVLNELLRMAAVEAHIAEDPARMRAAEAPVLVGDPSAIRRDTGWQPQIPLEQTLTDLYQWFLDM